jgi:hypothetical protein
MTLVVLEDVFPNLRFFFFFNVKWKLSSINHNYAKCPILGHNIIPPLGEISFAPKKDPYWHML